MSGGVTWGWLWVLAWVALLAVSLAGLRKRRLERRRAETGLRALEEVRERGAAGLWQDQESGRWICAAGGVAGEGETVKEAIDAYVYARTGGSGRV